MPSQFLASRVDPRRNLRRGNKLKSAFNKGMYNMFASPSQKNRAHGTGPAPIPRHGS